MSSDTSAPVVLVTGASRGIGRAAALALAQAGWHVVAVARAQKALEALDDAVRAETGKGLTLVPLDLKDGDSIDGLAVVLFERFGRLDALCHAAAILGLLTPVTHADPTLFEDVFRMNTMASYRLIRAMDPLLRRADPAGRAVFFTSGVAQAPRAYWAPYAASKAAQEAIVRAYAEEVAFTGVRVNLLSPGPVRTRMRADAFPGEDPMSLPPPEAIAPLVLELLSPSQTRTGEVVRYTAPADLTA